MQDQAQDMHKQAVPDSFSLQGRVALITGSSQGLGLEIARGYAAAGAKVIVHGRSSAKAAQVCEQLSAAGLDADWLAFDIADGAGRTQAFDAIQARHGRLDILVNNAGVRARSPLAELSEADIHRVVGTNLLAAIEMSRLAAALMRKRQYGRIINITSLQGRLARSGDFIYPITKQALEAMTRVAAVELGKDGILCNAIAPGTFATEFNRELTTKRENIETMQRRNPLRRWGEPSEIVGPAIFLASAAASYVNGHTIVLDGGYSASF